MKVKSLFFSCLLLSLVVSGKDVSDQPRSKAEKFAIEMLDPGIEFVWYSRVLRNKLIARLGIPDELTLTTIPDRTSSAYYACDTWKYEMGPTLAVCGDSSEWLSSFSLPVNTQYPLPYGLRVGYPRMDFVRRLAIEDGAKSIGDPILFSTEYHGSGGSAVIEVRIEFDVQGNSTRITWENMGF